jgi:hypothetical protein
MISLAKRYSMDKFNPTAYKNAYASEKYDRVSLMLPKGLKAEIQAKTVGSVNNYIVEAIKEKLKKEEK